MKFRTGFVSNSSSSSFMIPRRYVSDDQLEKIYNHMSHGKIHDDYYGFVGCYDDYNSWGIGDDENYVTGSASMDNFSMYTYLTKFLGINEDVIKWDD